jgi:cytidylate kinase
VREALLSIQRDLALVIEKGAIFEGRDIGTVVFPKADVKIFITANSETRARRRYNELKSLNKDITYDDILQSIKRRDQRDETRAASPTQRAADAHIIDTSDLTLTEVIDKALSLIKSAIKV